MSASFPLIAFMPAGPVVSPAPRASRSAFTLVEMLVVMGVIVLLASLVSPAFTSLRGSNDFTSEAARIAGTYEQARAYAMANNTYVYVCLGEYLASEPSGTKPRSPYIISSGANGGQLAVAVVASRNGTRNYDFNNPASSWSGNYASGALLMPIDKLALYDNIHLADFGSAPPTSGNMAHPAVTDDGSRLGSATCGTNTITTIGWPLGTTIALAQYKFTLVVQFDPQGVARIQTATNMDGIAPWMEIDLQPSHGTIIPALPTNQNTGNQVSILLDCMNGGARMYRP